MLNHFDLWSFDDVRRNAERIYGALAGEAMPCDAPWPREQKDLLRRWIDGGTPP